jgi:hypothetical protein
VKHFYPKDLAEYVHENWNGSNQSKEMTEQVQSGPKLSGPPDLAVLENLISICYQASLMTHEGEPVVFRLILADPGEFSDSAGPPDGVQKLELTEYLPLTPFELRRLSPAARFSRSMIGIRQEPDAGPQVWGVIHTGPRWLHTSHGGRGSPPALPESLVVKVMGPGILEVSKGNQTLVSLSDGKLHGHSLNVLRSAWLQEWFAPIRQERLEIHSKASRGSDEEWAELDPDLTRVIDQHMMKRVIAAMRAFRHGGTLIVVPPEHASMLRESNPYLTMKYNFADAEGRARFRALIVEIMNTLARLPADNDHPIGWRDYQQTTDPKVMALDEAIFEMSHLVSSLSVADGAVVLTKRFELLGFAAEIHCEAAEVRYVAKALDLEGQKYRTESVLGVGTRHRSAYRLCQQLRDALAIVVSQEGTVQFVRWNDSQLMFWEHQGSFDFSAIN